MSRSRRSNLYEGSDAERKMLTYARQYAATDEVSNIEGAGRAVEIPPRSLFSRLTVRSLEPRHRYCGRATIRDPDALSSAGQVDRRGPVNADDYEVERAASEQHRHGIICDCPAPPYGHTGRSKGCTGSRVPSAKRRLAENQCAPSCARKAEESLHHRRYP